MKTNALVIPCACVAPFLLFLFTLLLRAWYLGLWGPSHRAPRGAVTRSAPHRATAITGATTGVFPGAAAGLALAKPCDTACRWRWRKRGIDCHPNSTIHWGGGEYDENLGSLAMRCKIKSTLFDHFRPCSVIKLSVACGILRLSGTKLPRILKKKFNCLCTPFAGRTFI